MSEVDLNTQISKKKDEIKNIEALIKTSMEEDINNGILDSNGNRIQGKEAARLGEKTRKRLQGYIRKLKSEIEDLNKKPETVVQD